MERVGNEVARDAYNLLYGGIRIPDVVGFGNHVRLLLVCRKGRGNDFCRGFPLLLSCSSGSSRNLLLPRVKRQRQTQKVIKTMIKETGSENEQINQALEIADDYSGPSMVGALFVSAFISFWIAIFLDIFTLSVFGLFTCLIAKIKMNYKAVFNMSVYAITLSLILRTIYVVVTMLTSFEIKYFDVMYVAVAYISLAAAIFLIKSDVIKQHLELMKIIEEGKEKIEQTIVIPRKKDDEEKKENKDGDKEEKKENEKETEGQGSNA